MKKEEIINYLQENYFSDWVATRQLVENELSDKQSIFCVCGRLATGLHERNCRKFNNKVTNETVKRLRYLIK